MMLRRLLAPTVLGLALMGLSASGAGATIAETITTYDFAGVCEDCSGTAGAELELADYTPGDEITYDNFVSFHYDGTDLASAFTITHDDALDAGGDLATLPGPNDFYITDGVNYFASYSEGYWCVSEGDVDCSVAADFGFDHTWSVAGAAPEPATWAMMLVGVAGIGFAFRQAKKKHGFRFKDAFAG